jgi:hypothetical protein
MWRYLGMFYGAVLLSFAWASLMLMSTSPEKDTATNQVVSEDALYEPEGQFVRAGYFGSQA